MGGTVNETIKLILSLSVSGGLFALVLFALKPLMRNRLSKSFQYYIWLVVLLRFILPFSFGINLMDFTFNAPNAPQMVEETVIPNNNPTNPANINPAVDNNIVGNNTPNIAEQQPSTPVSTDSEKPLDIMKMLVDNLLWIWLAGAVISAAFNLLGYLRFIRYIRGVAYAVEMTDCGAKVYKSRFAPTPMLVGVIKPRIYLPDTEYTDNQLNNILLHELTHLRRRDIWLKWFSALVVSVHWFNPIVYFMRREFNRACELSCDESVIRNLDGAAKQSYGDTLISVVAESRYPFGVMSVTMCEEKTKLKERLIAIMNYKKKTKITVLITAVLAVMITSSAFAFGAGATGGFSANKPQSGTPNIVIPDAVGQDDVVYFDEGNIHFIFIDGANMEDAPTVSVTPGSIAIVLVDKNGYWTFSPYKDISALSDNIKAECIEMINRKENNGFSETHMAHIMKRVESIVNPTAAIIPRIEDSAQIIKLADLRQLAAKGYDLTFEDFDGYEGQDVGSGLYILHFTIEGGYTLLVGGGSPTGKPFYAYLSIPGVEGKIDIRYADIDEFISKHPVPNDGEPNKSNVYKIITQMAGVDTSLPVTKYTNEIVAICDAANTNIFSVLSDAAIVEPSDPLYAFATETLNFTSSELFADSGINSNERPHMSAYVSWSRYDTDEEIETQRGDMSDEEWNAVLNDMADYPPNIAAYKGVAYFVFYNIIDKDSLTIDERDNMLKKLKTDMQSYIEGLREDELFNDNFEAAFLKELIRVAVLYSNERMVMECEISNVEGFAPGYPLQ